MMRCLRKLSFSPLGASVLGCLLFIAFPSRGEANCVLGNGSIAFGGYDPITAHASSALQTTGSIAITCDNAVGALISIDQGLAPASGSTGDVPKRRLSSATSYLSYDLYRDSSHSVIWGNTVATSLSYTGTGSAQSLTIYGTLPAGQNATAGSYTDSLVVTVTY